MAKNNILSVKAVDCIYLSIHLACDGANDMEECREKICESAKEYGGEITETRTFLTEEIMIVEFADSDKKAEWFAHIKVRNNVLIREAVEGIYLHIKTAISTASKSIRESKIVDERREKIRKSAKEYGGRVFASRTFNTEVLMVMKFDDSNKKAEWLACAKESELISEG